jgi:lycopene cyclase domain-containing protein
MTHLLYLAVLAGCVLGTLPLERWLHTGVYARWRRLVATVIPVAVIFGGWDLLAIHQGTWSYRSRYVTGVDLPGRLPLEELLFFLIIPTCAVLTLEAVRARRPDWLIGDEPDEPNEASAGGDPP